MRHFQTNETEGKMFSLFFLIDDIIKLPLMAIEINRILFPKPVA